MPKRFFSVCESAKKYLRFFRKKFLMMILWTHQKQFSQPCRKSFARRPKLFGSFLKKNRTHTIFSIKCFPSNFLVETYISALAILLEVFRQKTGKLRPFNRNVKKYSFFSKNYNKMFLVHVENCSYNRKILLVVQNWRIKIFWNILLRI